MQNVRYPIETCAACHYVYWACACGDSPITGFGLNGNNAPVRPTRCNNQHCHTPTDLRLVTAEHCHLSAHHHLGDTCRHCGQKD